MSVHLPPGLGPSARLRARMLRKPAQHGFTLLEVMVALAVVAIALGAGLRAADVLTTNAQRLADVTTAQWCADNELTGLRLARQFPGVGESEFRCQQWGRSYTGKMITRPTPNPNFRRVEIEMLGDDGRVVATLATVLGRP